MPSAPTRVSENCHSPLPISMLVDGQKKKINNFLKVPIPNNIYIYIEVQGILGRFTSTYLIIFLYLPGSWFWLIA